MQPNLLRLEVLAFDADAAAAGPSQVLLQARWCLAQTDGNAPPPRGQAVTLQVPVEGSGTDALAAAHRLAVWRLTERVVATR